MLKLLIVPSLLFICVLSQTSQMDRPELVKSPITKKLVKLAINSLEGEQKLHLTNPEVMSVRTMIIRPGVSWNIEFLAEPLTTHHQVICSASFNEMIPPVNGQEYYLLGAKCRDLVVLP
ncbi:unnamed protein product [Didymodactylos carnosus]|uniref:Uncharacterized protein n=1 Tax=Didymodactylos carnosus TaxID=1234261 RepID=A0A816AUR7_9BILA|nr:unnamed protein product [Didymodactylos carnosus]CAF1602310.1 unnamed protein product [Didymodactylos carnosus]CAF3838274.1 unnamed protein product [Didymodactylos carnosus]CAF4480262.1 unnamed protein product [Didymodactylos carnosus]